jgi:dolichol-phosphate mannosyltransferase
MAAADTRVFVLHRTEEKRGLGRAYVAGFEWALARGYGYILEMDADLSHNPADVPRLLAAADSADLVIGSRYIDGTRVVDWPLHRLLLSRSASVYVRVVTGLPVYDPTGGFKCFRRATLEAKELQRIRSNGYSFQIEMTHGSWLQGFSIQEVPITFVERRTGRSKMTNAIVFEAIWMIWRLLVLSGFRRTPRARHPKSIMTLRESTTPPDCESN